MSEVILVKGFDIKDKAKELLSKIFNPGEKIAIKLHMGEKGNKYYLKPDFVKQIIDTLKKLGVKPFLFDSPVVYQGARDTVEKYLKIAKEHGYSKDKMGCPVIISNDYIEQKTKYFTSQVCRSLIEADGVLVLSHVKGHECAGFGGAIKNLGMGALTKETKSIIHTLGSPILDKDKCIGCGICVNVCPAHCVEIKDDKFYMTGGCWGCGNCIVNCPQEALHPKTALFDELLAYGAWSAWKNFKKQCYINVLKDISRSCDCDSNSGPIIARDIGVLFSRDPVSIDAASVYLVAKSQDGKDVFKEYNHKDPKLQIKFAEEAGMGEMDHRIKEI